MKLLELHLLQSYPVSCLNRDDVGSPKTAGFGGVNRARISSQCLKRAVREYARDHYPAARFNGYRTLRVAEQIRNCFEENNYSGPAASALAQCAAHYLAVINGKKPDQVTTLMFFSPNEYRGLTRALLELPEPSKEKLLDAYSRIDIAEVAALELTEDGSQEDEELPKVRKGGKISAEAFSKLVRKILKAPVREALGNREALKDASDISIFGRMIATDHTLTVEGAGMFNHALSTHHVSNEVDFFAAMDERNVDDPGAAIISTLEFTSALYYRYVALNLDLLADKSHLGGLDLADRRAVVDAFLRAAVVSVPGARRNTMNADTLPGYVLGLYHDRGQPLQLVNAFLQPVQSNAKQGGLLAASRTALEGHHARLKHVWGLAPTVEKVLSEDGDTTFEQFASELTAHVP